MGRNLGPLNIKDSYEGLVQISGSQLTDGSGSLIPNVDVTASNATTAVSSSYALTASFAENVVPQDTGSLLVTASVVDATTTYTKGDGSTFNTLIDNVTTANTASYVLGSNVDGTVATATSASHALVADTATTATSASYAVSSSQSENADTAVSSSYALTASFAENVSTPTLQEVTTEGATTDVLTTFTNGVKVSSSAAPSVEVQSIGGTFDPAVNFQRDTTYEGGIATTTSNLELYGLNGRNVKVSGSELIVDGNITASGDIIAPTLNAEINIDQGKFNQFITVNNDMQVSLSNDGTTTFANLQNTATTGKITLDASSGVDIQTSFTASGLNYPLTDGTTGQAITTDGSGNLTFNTVTTPTPDLQDVTDVDNTTTNSILIGSNPRTYGQNSILSAFGGQTYRVQGGTATSYLELTGNGTLTTNSIKINPTDGVEISGSVAIQDSVNIATALTASGLNYPITDGTTDQVLKTDGSGNLSFTTIAAGASTLQEVLNAGDNASGSNVILEKLTTSTVSPVTQSGNESTFILGAQVSESLQGNLELTGNTGSFIGGISADLTSYQTSSITNNQDSLIFGSKQINTFTGNNLVNAVTASAVLASTNSKMGTYSGGGGDGPSNHQAIIASYQAGMSGQSRFSAIIASEAVTMNGSGNPRFINTIIGTKNATINKGIYDHIAFSRDCTIPTSFKQDLRIVASNDSSITNGSKSNVLGGQLHTISTSNADAVGGYDNNITAGTYPGIYGGRQNNITGGGSLATILGSRSSTISGGDTIGIVLGQQNQITSGYGDYCIGGRENKFENRSTNSFASVIVGAYNSRIHGNTTGTSAILGGASNDLGVTADVDDSAIIVGNNHDMKHNRSVIIGGSTLTSTKDDEVTVPNLTVSGSSVYEVEVLPFVPGLSTDMFCDLSNYFTLDMGQASTTDLVPVNIQAGQEITLRVTQNATAGSTLTFDNSIEWAGGTAPTLSPGLGAVDVFKFTSFGGGITYGSIVGQNFS